MARIRTVKPEFWTSEQVVECSPITRLMFIGMWNFCDDKGNHPASCKTLKMEVFPGDDITTSEIERCVSELLKNNLIVKYDGGNGREYWHVTGWHHQKIEKVTEKHPPFDPSKITKFVDHSATTLLPVVDLSTPEGNGREGNSKGKETTSNPPLPPKEEDGDESPSEDGLRGESESHFDIFWKAYPKKVKKEEARKAFKKIKKPADTLKQIIDALSWQVHIDQWTKENGQYIPNPASYLNAGSWQDERPPNNVIPKRRWDDFRPPSKQELTTLAARSIFRDYGDQDEREIDGTAEFVIESKQII